MAGAKLASPEYEALMLWLPAESLLVDRIACPFALSVTGPAPSGVAGVVVASRKVTVPVGMPVAGAMAVTVAVKVTDCPSMDGSWFDTSPTVTAPLLTTWMSAVTDVDLTLAKLVSPEYAAVML